MQEKVIQNHNERFSSRLAFLLLSAGCAIGLGNVWRFPYIVGKNGGAIFVIIYLVFLFILGIPIMITELAVGRASQTSSVKSFKVLAPNGKKSWRGIGYLALAGNYLLLSYYTVITGWILYYVYLFAKSSSMIDDSAALFSDLLTQPSTMILWTVVVLAICAAICCLGFRGGVERITKYLMVLLFLIMVALAIKSLSLPGAVRGIKFYLVPDWQKFNEVGWLNVTVDAMMQAFFTLSLGVGAIAIFGSRIGKDRSLLNEAIHISALDTLIAITAGLIIFPAAATYNIEPGYGPSLIFITLPKIFTEMGNSQIFGTAFFIFMFFAALSTLIAVFENIITCCRDWLKISRSTSILINFVFIILLTIPNALGYNLWSGIHLLGSESTVLDFSDFLVSSNILPLGSLGYLCFSISRSGWGRDNFFAEVNTGRGLKVPVLMQKYMRLVLPFIVLAIWLLSNLNILF